MNPLRAITIALLAMFACILTGLCASLAKATAVELAFIIPFLFAIFSLAGGSALWLSCQGNAPFWRCALFLFPVLACCFWFGLTESDRAGDTICFMLEKR